MSEQGDILSILVGRELAAVTFVRDYIQMSFDGPVLTAVVDPVIRVNHRVCDRSEADYCNLLISLINRKVTVARAEDQNQIFIGFGEEFGVSISLKVEDLKFGPEAARFDTDNGRWIVWPGNC